MPRVRYTAEGGHYRVGGYGFDPGDEQDVDDELAEYLGDHEDFEVLEELGAEDDVAEDESEIFDPADHTVDEIEEAVADVEDPDWLETVREAETEGDDRTTALEAIDDRLDELEG